MTQTIVIRFRLPGDYTSKRAWFDASKLTIQEAVEALYSGYPEAKILSAEVQD